MKVTQQKTAYPPVMVVFESAQEIKDVQRVLGAGLALLGAYDLYNLLEEVTGINSRTK